MSVGFLLTSFVMLHFSCNTHGIDCTDLEEVRESDQEFRSLCRLPEK